MILQDEIRVRATIRSFVSASVSITEVDDDEDLFDTGIVNSLFAVQLMTFLEKTFGIEITTDDLDFTNFKSIGASATFVLRKRGRIEV